MKKLALIAVFASTLALTACGGSRGYVGNQKVCENDYFLGVISISELFSPCTKK